MVYNSAPCHVLLDSNDIRSLSSWNVSQVASFQCVALGAGSPVPKTRNNLLFTLTLIDASFMISPSTFQLLNRVLPPTSVMLAGELELLVRVFISRLFELDADELDMADDDEVETFELSSSGLAVM